jgi:hypothetical protein
MGVKSFFTKILSGPYPKDNLPPKKSINSVWNVFPVFYAVVLFILVNDIVLGKKSYASVNSCTDSEISFGIIQHFFIVFYSIFRI